MKPELILLLSYMLLFVQIYFIVSLHYKLELNTVLRQ
jgi:hypothetical protein